MERKQSRPEEIVANFRGAEVLLGQRMKITETVNKLGVRCIQQPISQPRATKNH